ncbi:DUF427 domain-containing protein [Qipengyuania marisflavi]|uniref:DUF427 domain-containing protein n=1 Tax=Qipengyuania marisflavi TaxID=2486356 RepID=A0A5S3P1V1_9SPHN|nr:DUF427 domain-containing protein [Qipengyuania marisflavi]TMM46712.1 DUF427 domain-containing protein [Qipengyuania marisflavi]
MTIIASWNGEVLARSEETVVVEGNHYFPAKDVNRGVLVPSEKTTVCPWKGTAGYFSINAGGQINEDAAWVYAQPKEAATQIKDHIAFWKGVEISQA